jgi:hypothetical protein
MLTGASSSSMVYVFKIAYLMIGFLIISQAFSSYELLGSEFDKENEGRKRRNANVTALKPFPIFKEQASVNFGWHEIKLQEIELQRMEKNFRQAFVDNKKHYNLLEMIKRLKLVYGDKVAFESRAKNTFKVHELEHLQFLWHCCKEAEIKEQEKAQELKKENKELRYFHTNDIIMEVIRKNTDWSR